MRSLALLLLLLNLGFLFWQLKWLPSWQLDQFAQTLWPSNSQESDLQRPILLDEPDKLSVVDKSDNFNHVQKSNFDTNVEASAFETVTHTPIKNNVLMPDSQTDVKISQGTVANLADPLEKQAIALNENSKMTVDLTEVNTTAENQTKERSEENAMAQESEKNQVVAQILENANTKPSNQTVVNTAASEINPRVSEQMLSKLQEVAGLHKTEAQSSVQEQSKPVLSQQSIQPHKSIKEPSPQIIKKPSKPLACFRSGPYTQASVVQKKANWLKNQNNVSVEVQSRKTQVLESTWVYLPSFESRQVALQTEQRLLQLNIDCYVVKKGQFNNAISLGLYRRSFNVEPRLKQLRAKGYQNVKTQKRYKNHTKYWLNVKIFADQSKWLNQQKQFKRSHLTTVACEYKQ